MLRIKYILSFILFCSISFVQAQINLPDAPDVDTVSVEPISVKGDVYISWYPMDPAEIKGYIIYRNTGTAYTPVWENLDTIYGGASTFYQDFKTPPPNGQNADGRPESYRLRSFDAAGTKSLLSDSMTTMYTFPYIEENNCINHIRVHWTSYIGWKTGVSKYEVYCSVDNGPYSLIGTSIGSENNFYHTNPLDSTSYTYYVKATSYDGRTSTSNSVRTFTDFPNTPKFVYSNYATVEGSYIKLEYTLDDFSEVQNYRLMRADSLTGNYIPIKTFLNWPFPNLTYKDNTVDLDKIYYYRLDVIDPCGNILLSSNAAKNIEINVVSNSDFSPVITWDKYFDWAGGDVEYRVYRIINDDVKLIHSTFTGLAYYKDNISQEDIATITGKVCYQVKAIEGDSNPYGIKAESKSTIKCMEQVSYVVMPDAFTPNNDRINDIFKPLAIFISNDNYYFEVYNRWGEKIFSTTDPTEGWTGRDTKDRVSPENIYFYILQYQDFYDEVFHMSGEVTLIF